MKYNLPNMVSLSRIVISPFFLMLLISGDQFKIKMSVVLFIVGAITDYLDGWLARKFHQVSSWGKFFDPLADKVLTTSAFISFVIMGIIPMWMVSVIIFRDLATTALRKVGEKRGKPMETSKSAKTKTFVQMGFIAYILSMLAFDVNEVVYSEYTYWFMLFLTAYTVWTLVEYILNNKTIFLFGGREQSGA